MAIQCSTNQRFQMKVNSPRPVVWSCRTHGVRNFMRGVSGGKCRGFTLIEVMVVVAIIAILAAIALPSYLDYLLRTRIRTAQSDLLALSTQAENYRQRTLQYYASAASDTAAVQAVFPGWTPGAKSGDFSYSYEVRGGSGYTLKAVAGSALGKASGCEISVDDENTRTVGSACASVGVTDWK